ncbi:MAG: hypothetical protein ACK4VN_08205 [Bacteroidales bacterium]
MRKKIEKKQIKMVYTVYGIDGFTAGWIAPLPFQGIRLNIIGTDRSVPGN